MQRAVELRVIVQHVWITHRETLLIKVKFVLAVFAREEILRWSVPIKRYQQVVACSPLKNVNRVTADVNQFVISCGPDYARSQDDQWFDIALESIAVAATQEVVVAFAAAEEVPTQSAPNRVIARFSVANIIATSTREQVGTFVPK